MPVSTLAPDQAAARNLMVDGQLRPSKVIDRRILDAMRRLRREDFVPAAMAGRAYIDDDIQIVPGRFLLKPLVIARLLQLARPAAGEAVLMVGAGSGYGAAVLAACGVQVTALEEDAALLAMGRQACTDPGVSWVAGKLADGYAARAPYDLVVIEGAVRAIPAVFTTQVGANGRLATIIWPADGASHAVLAEPSTGGLSAQPAFDLAAPLLSPLAQAAAFSF